MVTGGELHRRRLPTSRLLAEHHAKIIGPQHDCQDSLPERQVQKPDGKKPGGNPDSADKTLLVDLDFFHDNEFTPIAARANLL